MTASRRVTSPYIGFFFRVDAHGFRSTNGFTTPGGACGAGGRLLAGALIGFFAKKVRSLPAGLIFGLVVGAFLAFLVAAMPQPTGEHYWWQIMLPGSVVGLIVGYATQQWGAERAA